MDYSADHGIFEENDPSILLLDGIVIQGEILALVRLSAFVQSSRDLLGYFQHNNANNIQHARR